MNASTSQAAAHEDLTTEFDFAHDPSGHTYNDVRTIVVNLPAGFTASSTAVPTCTFGQLLAKRRGATVVGEGETASACPPETQVGTITFDLTGIDSAEPLQRDTFPLYNMETTTFGVSAELGFRSEYITQVLLVSVRPGDSGLTVTTPNIEGVGEPHAISVTVWGVPADKSHDPERGMECLPGVRGYPNPHGGPECTGGGEEVDIPVKPLMSNPTSCGGFHATMSSDSWEQPSEWSRAETEVGPIGGCERVHFDPGLEVQPTTRSAESPSGLDLSLVVPQTWGEPSTFATSNLKDTTVTLPEGYTLNPSAGSGLAGCTPAQYEAETYSSPPGAGCPPESKLGTVEIETPVLAETIRGNVYLATPYQNPFGSLVAMYVVAKAPDRGVIVKSAGRVETNVVTGQITSTFQDTPQQPFTVFTLKFRQGATSPLVSPPACGTYTVQASLTPWSAPLEPRLLSNSFPIEAGIGGGPCPPGGVPPFKPTVISGTQSNAAGSYSPFYLRIARNDGEEEITKFTSVFPPGLSGNLTGIPFCSESAIEAARKATGRQELASPSCPAASEIGHSLVGAGVGGVLAWTPGKVYLSGPYHGSALSLVSVTSATVGPFDLGTVVIRFALRINPTTAQVEVDSTSSDPIPHIIDGIVVHVRDIHVYIDRPDFMLNPTNCDPMSIGEAITGAGASIASSADDQTVNVTSRFQDADCLSLRFKPKFTASTSGRASRKNGIGLVTKLGYPAGSLGTQANIRSVKVSLPRQLPSRIETLQRACLDSVFNANPAACPPASRVGTASTTTPIVPVPLSGPVYFVSHGAREFPDLMIVLQGYGITVDLRGETHISKGLTSTTFHTIPDVPVGSFQLDLPPGPFSALSANGNLCKARHPVTVTKRVRRRIGGRLRYVNVKVTRQVSGLVMPTILTAQNGVTIRQSTRIGVAGCAKAVAGHPRGRRKGKG